MATPICPLELQQVDDMCDERCHTVLQQPRWKWIQLTLFRRRCPDCCYNLCNVYQVELIKRSRQTDRVCRQINRCRGCSNVSHLPIAAVVVILCRKLSDRQTLRELLPANVIFVFQYSAALTWDAFVDAQRADFHASRDAGVLSVLKRHSKRRTLRLVSLNSSLNHYDSFLTFLYLIWLYSMTF